MQKAVSGEEGDDERTSQESGSVRGHFKPALPKEKLEYVDSGALENQPGKLGYQQPICGENNLGGGRQRRTDGGGGDAAVKGAGVVAPNEGDLHAAPSEYRTSTAVSGVRVLPPFHHQPYHHHSDTLHTNYPNTLTNEQIVKQNTASVHQTSPSSAHRPIAKVKVTSYVQPKFYSPSPVLPSAPTREVIYNEPIEKQDLRSQPIGEEAEPPYELKDPPAWSRQESSSPSLSGILKKSPHQKCEEVKHQGSPKIKFKNGNSEVVSERFDLGAKPPIPGKSSSSSPSNNSPVVPKANTSKPAENVFKRNVDNKPNLFSDSGVFKNQRSFGFPSQKSSFGGASSAAVIRRPEQDGARSRRGADRESGALVWVTQPGGGAKLDWVATPNLSTLRSQPNTPGARVTRQGSDVGIEHRPPDPGGGRQSVERMQSAEGAVGGGAPPVTTCSPPILKHTQSSESKNVHRSAPSNARLEGRSKSGEADGCVVAVPGRASGQIVRIRVRPEVHAYLAGLPVTSSPGLGDRRDSLRSVHSAHSSSASALTGCSESGGEGSAGYHDQDYSSVVDEYTLLQKAVVDHDPEAMRLLSAAEAAVDPGQRVILGAGQFQSVTLQPIQIIPITLP